MSIMVMLREARAHARGGAAARLPARARRAGVVWKTETTETCACYCYMHHVHIVIRHKQNLSDHSVSAGHTSLGHSHAKFSSARACSRSPHQPRLFLSAQIRSSPRVFGLRLAPAAQDVPVLLDPCC